MTRGIRTLDDFRGRCIVDELGCWIWTLAQGKNGVPVAHLAGPTHRRSLPARRAGWLLAGKPLREGQAVYLRAACSTLCVNPDHCRAGRLGDAQRAASKRGSFDTPHRKVQLLQARERQLLPADTVRAIEAAIAGGMTAKRAAQLHGVGEESAQRIRRGEHAHQRQRLVRAASVFALGGT